MTLHADDPTTIATATLPCVVGDGDVARVRLDVPRADPDMIRVGLGADRWRVARSLLVTGLTGTVVDVDAAAWPSRVPPGRRVLCVVLPGGTHPVRLAIDHGAVAGFLHRSAVRTVPGVPTGSASTAVGVDPRRRDDRGVPGTPAA